MHSQVTCECKGDERAFLGGAKNSQGEDPRTFEENSQDGDLSTLEANSQGEDSRTLEKGKEENCEVQKEEFVGKVQRKDRKIPYGREGKKKR